MGNSGDHCRIGSLETYNLYSQLVENDHCRIGSLEKKAVIHALEADDHCRIGSLEICGFSGKIK